MPMQNTPHPTPVHPHKTSLSGKRSNYSRFFEAGRDSAVIGDKDAQAAHGLVPTTPEERQAWDAGRASIGLNILM